MIGNQSLYFFHFLNSSVIHNQVTALHLMLIQRIHGITQKLKEMLTTYSNPSTYANVFCLPSPLFFFLDSANFFWAVFGLRKVKTVTSFSQIAPIMVIMIPLFEGNNVFAGVPRFGRPKFLQIFVLKHASSIKTQFFFKFIFLSAFNSKTLFAQIKISKSRLCGYNLFQLFKC